MSWCRDRGRLQGSGNLILKLGSIEACSVIHRRNILLSSSSSSSSSSSCCCCCCCCCRIFWPRVFALPRLDFFEIPAPGRTVRKAPLLRGAVLRDLSRSMEGDVARLAARDRGFAVNVVELVGDNCDGWGLGHALKRS